MKPARLLGFVSGLVTILCVAFLYTQRSYLGFIFPQPVFAKANFIGVFEDSASSAYKLDPAASTSLTVAGKVGIGATSPTSMLVISDTTADSTNYGQTVQITRVASAGQHIAFVRQGSIVRSIGYLPNSNTFGIGGGTQTDSSFSPSFLAIDSAGNVGIGKTAPGQTLDVAGTAAFSNTIYIPGTGTNNISPGTGDGATYATYNFTLRGWFGMALTDYAGTVHGVYDFRSGNLTTDGLLNFKGAGANTLSGSLNVGGTGNVWGSINGTSIVASSQIYSYSYICTGNWNGGCNGTAGVSLYPGAPDTTNGTPYAAISGGGKSWFNGGNVGFGTSSPDTYLDGTFGLAVYSSTYPGISWGNTAGHWTSYMPSGSTDLRFYNGADRVWLLSNGSFGIGVSPSYTLDVNGTTNLRGHIYMNGTIVTSTLPRWSMFYVGCGGSWASSCDVGSSGWPDYADALVSDARLKNIGKPLTGVMDKLMQLTPVYYTWNDKYTALGLPNHGQEIGLIAQNIQPLFPELVFHAGPTDPYLHTDYQKFTAVLLAGIKEQQQQIDELKKTVEDRKQTISELQTELDQIKARQ